MPTSDELLDTVTPLKEYAEQNSIMDKVGGLIDDGPMPDKTEDRPISQSFDPMDILPVDQAAMGVAKLGSIALPAIKALAAKSLAAKGLIAAPLLAGGMRDVSGGIMRTIGKDELLANQANTMGKLNLSSVKPDQAREMIRELDSSGVGSHDKRIRVLQNIINRNMK